MDLKKSMVYAFIDYMSDVHATVWRQRLSRRKGSPLSRRKGSPFK